MLIGGETVGLDEDGWTYELEDGWTYELEDEVGTLEDDPVAQEDFPTQAALGIWLAAAEPTRAATKTDNEACMMMEGVGDRTRYAGIVSGED